MVVSMSLPRMGPSWAKQGDSALQRLQAKQKRQTEGRETIHEHQEHVDGTKHHVNATMSSVGLLGRQSSQWEIKSKDKGQWKDKQREDD